MEKGSKIILIHESIASEQHINYAAHCLPILAALLKGQKIFEWKTLEFVGITSACINITITYGYIILLFLLRKYCMWNVAMAILNTCCRCRFDIDCLNVFAVCKHFVLHWVCDSMFRARLTAMENIHGPLPNIRTIPKMDFSWMQLGRDVIRWWRWTMNIGRNMEKCWMKIKWRERIRNFSNDEHSDSYPLSDGYLFECCEWHLAMD